MALLPLLALFWYAQRFSAKDIGFTWGTRAEALRSYGLAVLYPLVVMGVIAGIAALSGTLDPAAAPHKHNVWLNLFLAGGTTIPVVLLTEEGFFRGWLWQSIKQTGQENGATLLLTSVAFALWHRSSVMLRSRDRRPWPRVK
ncbi:MAG TPA: CPBP family glutamic-type intramembrane protease [Candidatus Baltobacteraceae bacterium]|nr:CPBP family glutamic-type intramembrane protease [Candidatus Baltobacteraceae bacterium]